MDITDSKAENPGYHRISLNQKDPNAQCGIDREQMVVGRTECTSELPLGEGFMQKLIICMII